VNALIRAIADQHPAHAAGIFPTPNPPRAGDKKKAVILSAEALKITAF